MAAGEPSERVARQPLSSSGKPIDPSIARNLSEFSRWMAAESDTAAVMDRIVRASVSEIDGATGAAITLMSKGKVSSPTHSDDRARRVSEAQESAREGPCIDTSRDEVTMRSDDLRRDTRWPAWAAVAIENGVLSVLSFQLYVENDNMGALDIYGPQPNAFGPVSENTGLLLASHAAIALGGSRKVDNLRIALDSRDVIGQAKGVLMERLKIDAAKAFDLLAYISQRENVKLYDLAESIASTGVLPNAG